MTRAPLQILAALWALLCALALAVLQFGGFPHPPLVFFLIFAGVWLFGAAMLWWLPVFGAVGTALYGVVLAADLLSMHGSGGQNALLAALSLAGSALAVAALLQVRRRSARA
jgi:hypothetical protein